jgi:ABC-2 type transport system permease protein
MMPFRLAWLEGKLLLREPATLAFTLGLPIVNELVLGGMFGNETSIGYFRDVPPIDFYMGAYIALVMAAIGLIILPTHIATYRERGVMRRLEASSISKTSVLAAHTIVLLVLAGIRAILVVCVGSGVYGAGMPVSWGGVLLAFVLGALAFAMVGTFLGLALPTSRAALGLGIILWFVMLLLGGAGPPPEVLPDAMTTVGSLTPLGHVVVLVQDPWLGFGWNWVETVVVLGILAGSAALSVLVNRIRSTAGSGRRGRGMIRGSVRHRANPEQWESRVAPAMVSEGGLEPPRPNTGTSTSS